MGSDSIEPRNLTKTKPKGRQDQQRQDWKKSPYFRKSSGTARTRQETYQQSPVFIKLVSEKGFKDKIVTGRSFNKIPSRAVNFYHLIKLGKLKSNVNCSITRKF